MVSMIRQDENVMPSHDGGADVVPSADASDIMPPVPDQILRDDANRSGPSLFMTIIIILLLILVLGALAVATLSAVDLGWPAFVMVLGAAIVGIFCLSTLWLSRRNMVRDSEDAGPLDFDFQARIFAESYEHRPDPVLLMQEGRPELANKAYRDWAEAMGFDGVSDAPPSLSQLLLIPLSPDAGDDTDIADETPIEAALFRLHRGGGQAHTSGDGSRFEDIDSVGPEGQFRRYRISVRAFAQRSRSNTASSGTASIGGVSVNPSLWHISDVTDSEGTVEQALIQAPIGLLSITEDGLVRAKNAVLDRWLGSDDPSDYTTLDTIIRDPEALLDHPKMPGRVVRADTHLITRKGMVTPVIMVASWQEHVTAKSDTPTLVANIAFYGHSTLSAPTLSTATNGASEDTYSIDAPLKPMPAQDGTGLSPHYVSTSEGAHESFLASPFAILELDGWDIPKAIIINANPAFETMMGRRSWKGQVLSDIFDANVPLQALMDNPHAPVEAILLGTESRPVSVYITADPSDMSKRWAYLVDISAQKSLEDQLVQSQKMQAIGQLAAGVAHDFNNLLTTMRLNADELLGRHPIGDPSYQELNSINTTINRAAALVKKLLAFSRQQTLRMQLIVLTDLLSELKVHLQQSLGERVSLDVIHGRNLPLIRGDASQIDTVLLNLCVNARDAMESKGGGRITIETSSVGRGPMERDGITNMKGEAFVRLAFSDTGTGMSEDVKAKIFEPFFTTKDQGKGTGLGLATVYGIVEQLGGYMAVQSKLGVGTTFNLYFPVAEAEADEDVHQVNAVKAAKPAPKPRDLTGQGTILFVEDEISVRAIAAKTLRKRGYKVIEAGDGEEALELLEEADAPFDLMISDVVMPGMDGPTLLKKGRALLGDARIIFISGYAEDDFSELLSEEPDVSFMPKPFTLSELAARVKSEIGVSQS